MRIIIISLLITSTFVSCIHLNRDNDKIRIDKVCDNFMSLFVTGKYVNSLKLLKENTVIDPLVIDTLGVTINKQINSYFPAYGKMLSAEFIVERKIKNVIAKRFYLLKFEKYFLRFDFTLYNNGNGWTITNFNYDEGLIEILY